MATDDVTITARDFEEAVNYLEGLTLILHRFAERDSPTDPRPDLLQALQQMPHSTPDPYYWAPLRYEPDTTGWQFVADNLTSLLDRLGTSR